MRRTENREHKNNKKMTTDNQSKHPKKLQEPLDVYCIFSQPPNDTVVDSADDSDSAEKKSNLTNKILVQKKKKVSISQ